MSTFDTIGDAAHSLRTEGQEIRLTFKKGVPTTGQGTIEWNIPGPAHGCTSGETGAYAGILLLLSKEPVDATNIPQDGKVYVADNTADFDLSTADRIGNALVVGAIYECEKKARGETLTTSSLVMDLEPGTAYYIAGYALDCQNRYHSDGIRAYSDMYGEKETNVPSVQNISLGTNGSGVLPTDGTGLVAGTNYEFDIVIDDTYPAGTNVKMVEVTMDGIDAGTYQALVDNINKQILLVDNPPLSPMPPNTNSFWWDENKQQLFQFDGVKYNPIDSLVEPADPQIVGTGQYWYDPITKVLNRRNGSVWDDTPYVQIESDPNTPTCDTYWFNATGSPINPNEIARKWEGNIWCDQETFIQATDPSDCPVFSCGTYWYDENKDVQSLFEWDITTKSWAPVSAIYWPESPNMLSSGTYWFDNTTNKLFQRTGSPLVWTDISLTTKIQETKPSNPSDQMLWYKPSTEELKQYSTGSPVAWNDVPVLVWPDDPTVTESCDLWWDAGSPEVLHAWDSILLSWQPVVSFTQSTIDPSFAITISVDAAWYDTVNDILFRWDGASWFAIEYMSSPVDPIVPIAGNGWYKPSTNEWKIWNGITTVWDIIDPVDSTFDPIIIPLGTYWFDTSISALFNWNGTGWVSVAFTTIPFVHVRNSQWYDSTNNELMVWDGTAWAIATPIATVSFDAKGSLIFVTTGKGSNNVIMVPSPSGAVSSTSPCSIGTGYAYHGVNDISYAECEYYDNKIQKVYQVRAIPDDIFLWNFVKPTPNILRPHTGNDGKSGTPSYAELGVGDDGTPDERRELMDSIRAQLGYPVVEVELTNYQLDTCIQGALESFRKRASAAYRRGFFFLDIEPGKQQYLMTNKVLGYNKIVNITGAYRFTSAFLSSAHGAGVYGQVVLQHLYNMGTYDLTSFFLVSQYIEQLEDLFATRLTFGWHETEKVLAFYSSFVRPERVLLDCMIERTEQDLMKDRYIKTWIERYALSEAMMMLSHIRGKFASLPGAGGGISLNAGELITISQSYRDELLQQVEDFIVDAPEDVGQFSTFVLG